MNTFHTQVIQTDGPTSHNLDMSYRMVDVTDSMYLEEDLSEEDWGKYRTKFVGYADDEYITGNFNNYY